MIKKGSYVEIVQEALCAQERTASIPEDTKMTPLKLWAKGWLLYDCSIGCAAAINTINGRILEGIITGVNPSYSLNFGEFIPEIMFIGMQAKSILWGDEVEQL